REIDRRVSYLAKRMEELRIVDYAPEQEGRIYFGAYVEIENSEGQQRQFRIVGYDEIFSQKDCISVDSPMARALLKKQVGDEVIVQTPEGEALWFVIAIRYT